MKARVVKPVSIPSTLLIMAVAFSAISISIDGFKAMMPLVSAEFGLSSAQAGFYATFFYVVGVALAIFSGQIADKIGPRRGLIGAVSVIAAMMFLHTIVPYYPIILGLAFFTGAAFSVVTPSLNKGVIEMVDPSKRATSNGIVHAGASFGGIIASYLLPTIGEALGWRTAVLIAVGFALFVTVVLIRTYQPINNNGDKSGTKKDNKGQLKTVVKMPLVWIVAIMGIVVGLSVGSITIHYSLFLTGDLAFTASTAGFFLALFNAGGILGNPLFGYINDRFLHSNRRIALFGLSLGIATLYLFMGGVIIQGVLPGLMLGVFSFVLGMFSFAVIGMLFTTVGDVAGAKLMGTATAIILISIRLTMVIAPPLIGFLADISGSYALSWFTSAIAIAAIGTLFMILTAPHKDTLRRTN